MPCASYATVVSLPQRDVFDLIRDPLNFTRWDPSIESAEGMDPDDEGRARWRVIIKRIGKKTLVYTLKEVVDPSVVIFEAQSEDSTVSIEERYIITPTQADANKTDVDYNISITMRGWWRIPCAMALTWIQLSRDAFDARVRLSEIERSESLV